MADRSLTDKQYEASYAELQRLAAAQLRNERPGHTLDPTSLVNEAYLKLLDANPVEMADKSRFFGFAARAMRQILVDHARKRRAVKRGGERQRVTLTTSIPGVKGDVVFEVLAFDQALIRLAALDDRASRVAELRILGGLTLEETAGVLGVSTRTVADDWAMARMWLVRELTAE